MEFTLLDAMRPIVDRLNAFDRARELDAFAEQVLEQRSDAFEGVAGAQALSAARGIARHVIPELKEIPALADMLCDRLAEEPAPAVRLAIAVSLAYLVNPEDYLSDDLSACYGYVDDLAVLWAMLGTTVLVYNPASAFGRYGEGPSGFVGTAVSRIRTCSMCVPSRVAGALQGAMAELMTIVQAFQFWPEEMVNARTRELIENPYVRVEVPPPAPGQPTVLRTPGPETFSLPRGGVGYSDDGLLAYQFEDGGQIAL